MTATSSSLLVVFLLLLSVGHSTTSFPSSITAPSDEANDISDFLYDNNIECWDGYYNITREHFQGTLEQTLGKAESTVTKRRGCRHCTLSFTFNEDMDFLMPQVNVDFGCKENLAGSLSTNRECTIDNGTCTYSFICQRNSGCQRSIYNFFSASTMHWSFMRCLGAMHDEGIFKLPDSKNHNLGFIWIACMTERLLKKEYEQVSVAVTVSTSAAFGAKIWCSRMEAGKYRLLMEIEKEKRVLKEMLNEIHQPDDASPAKGTPLGGSAKRKDNVDKSAK